MIDSNSPLRFLDYDVTRLIYDTYCPTELTKQRYNLVMDQLNYFLKWHTTYDYEQYIWCRSLCHRTKPKWYTPYTIKGFQTFLKSKKKTEKIDII